MIYNKNLIKLNLSFFDDKGDKTEQPTSKKKQDTRKEGQVAQSKEVGTAFLFLSIFVTLRAFAPWMYDKMYQVFANNFALLEDMDAFYTEGMVVAHIYTMFGMSILTAAPILAVSLLVGLITNIVQVGWHPTTKPLKPKFSKLNPISGFKRIFSMKLIVDLIKNVAIFSVVFYVIYADLSDKIELIPLFMDMSLMNSTALLSETVVDMGIKIGMYYLFIAAVDYGYTLFKHNKDIKMSKQEIKDEYKNAEGDPQIKSKIKQKMREASMRRMMTDVPNADVIITNPTHYAVAIKYDRAKSEAPFVMAKGTDHLAKRIKDIAKDNSVQIVEDKPLARALYATVDVGKEIPPELYQAVAEILAFVYKLKNVT